MNITIKTKHDGVINIENAEAYDFNATPDFVVIQLNGQHGVYYSKKEIISVEVFYDNEEEIENESN